MTARAWGYLVLLSVLWGASFLFVRIAVSELPPVTVVFFRLLIATLTLGVVVVATRESVPRGSAAWIGYGVMAILNNVAPFILIVWAQTQIDAGLAAILNALSPVFGVVFSHFLTADEKITPNRLAGVLLGLAGVAILVGVGALDKAGAHILPELAVVGASALYGLSAVWSRRFRGQPPVVTATSVSIASTVMLLPLMLAADAPWTLPWPSLPVVLAVTGVAVLSTALAYLVFYRLVTLAGGANTLLVTLLIPVSAISLASIFLGERLQAHQFAGMAVIALGLVAIDGRVLRWLRGRLGQAA